jgi:hypothetical protein
MHAITGQAPEKRANELVPWKIGGRTDWRSRTFQYSDKLRQHFVLGANTCDWTMTILKDR